MNVSQQGRLGQIQQVIVTLNLPIIVGKPVAAERLLIQFLVLNHGSHTAVENHNAFLQGFVKLFQASVAIGHSLYSGCRY